MSKLLARGFLTLFCITAVKAQLIINVKNQGGDILQETLSANVTEDVVALEFQRPDGTLVTQFQDFPNEVQIFKIIMLDEEEQNAFLNIPPVPLQIFCFVLRLPRNDFIAADAIAKLRQKNPNAIRVSEEDRGKESSLFDYSVILQKSSSISRHVGTLCHDANMGIYTKENDIKFWASMKTPAEAGTVLSAVQQSDRLLASTGPCREAAFGTPCKCQLQFCIPWFPCGLKFCRGRDSAGKALSYRCGIKTCKKCLAFEFAAAQKENCMWDS